MQVIFLVFLFVIGACLGSFLCCQARRLHLKLQKGTKHRLSPRSVCLHCGYQLKWYDNLPIVSWLFLRGKCRKCHKKIGLAELLSELGVACAYLALGLNLEFGASRALYLTQPSLAWAIFAVSLIFVSILAFLAIYDGLYGELPTVYLTISIICAIIILCLKEWLILSNSIVSWELIWKPIASVAILGGLYLVLYLVSKGKWVGDGDWLLGTAIGLALFEPWLAFLTLFIANLLACLVMAPPALGRKHRKIYFGPFMVTAFIITISMLQ